VKAFSKKKKSAKVLAIKEQIKSGYSGDFGFMHIPKTGGTGVNAFGKSLVERGHRFPCIFGHGWTVQEILENFPKIQINFILRDPLSKMISGFNSRIRQGRPTYNSIWTPGEASAFTLFPSVRNFFDAILADDEFNKSAVAYTMRRVRHLHWNYGFYFKNLETIRANQSSFRLIGTMETLNEFVGGMTALVGAPESLAREFYEKQHESSTRAEQALEGYSPKEINRIRNFLRRDYRIYSELMTLSGRPTASDLPPEA